jgi:hypothetical protein
VPEPSAWLARVAEVVAGRGLRWAEAGALAANRYRLAPRLTADADALTSWVEDLPSLLEAAGFSVGVYADTDEPPHLLIVRDGAERTDLLLVTTEYQDVALTRGDANGHVLTVEDVIVHKLIAWRPKDRDDLASILAADGARDDDYIATWAEAWDVGDRWQRAVSGDFSE